LIFQRSSVGAAVITWWVFISAALIIVVVRVARLPHVQVVIVANVADLDVGIVGVQVAFVGMVQAESLAFKQ